MPVVDASVVVDWVAPGVDPRAPSGRTLDRLAKEPASLVAPRVMVEEVSNALLTGIRRRRWDGAAADSAFALLRQLPIRLVDEPADLGRAWDLARRYDEHPLYDMLYVAVAERLGEQFITADLALARRLAHLPWVLAVDGPGPTAG